MTAADLVHSLFAESIAPLYSQHVKVLDLTSIPADLKDELLPALALLPGPFECLMIPSVHHAMPVAHLSGFLDGTGAMSEDDEAAFWEVADAFESLLQKTIRAEFRGAAINDGLFTCVGTSVATLDLTIDTTSGFESMLQVMAECPALTSLTVRIRPDLDELDDRLPLGREKTIRPVALKHLRFNVPDCTANLHRLCGLFASSLEHLELVFSSAFSGESRSFPVAPAYPKLRRIDIAGHRRILLLLMDNLSSSTYPSLQHLTIRTPSTEGMYRIRSILSDRFQQALDRLAAVIVKPLDVSVCYEDEGTEEDIILLPTDLHARAPLRLVAFDGGPSPAKWPHEAFSSPERLVKARSAELDEAHKAIDESLDAMRDQADWARRTGDRVQLAEMAEALQEWEALRYRWRL